MHLANDYQVLVLSLCDLDQLITSLLEQDEINVEEIVYQVDKREQILLCLTEIVRNYPETVDQTQWEKAIERTHSICTLMSNRTSEFESLLRKVHHGKRSVRQYQKFL